MDRWSENGPLIEEKKVKGKRRLGITSIVGIRFAMTLVFAHLRSKSTNRSGRTSLILVVLGMGAGVMMLTSVLGVMNGLQLNFIEDLVEIGSFHVRARSHVGRAIDPGTIESIRALPAVRVIMPFSDLTAMVGRPGSNDRHGMNLRAVPADVWAAEPVFADQLGLGKNPILPDTVIIGAAAASQLGVGVGDAIIVDLIDRISSNVSGAPIARETQLIVAGTFVSSYYEYDLSWGLISLSTANSITSGQLPLEYGIKLVDRFRERTLSAAIEEIIAFDDPENDYTVKSWRDFNQALYGALRTEKLLMTALIGLVFIVVSFNMFYLTRRRIQERQQEIGVLRALGATPMMLRAAYSVESAVVGTAGVACGVAAGMAIAGNLTALLELTELVINMLLSVATRLTSAPSTHTQFVSVTSFYIEVVPSRIILYEVVITCVIAIGSGLVASLAAGRWIETIAPERILREAHR